MPNNATFWGALLAAGAGLLLATPAHAVVKATATQSVNLSVVNYLSISWTVSPSAGTNAFSLKNANHPTQTVTIGATISCNYAATVGVSLTTTPGGFTIGNAQVNTATVGPTTNHVYSNLASFDVTQPGEGSGTTIQYDIAMAGGVVTIHSHKTGSTDGVVTVTVSGS
jgi:hypothetical protein